MAELNPRRARDWEDLCDLLVETWEEEDGIDAEHANALMAVYRRLKELPRDPHGLREALQEIKDLAEAEIQVAPGQTEAEVRAASDKTIAWIAGEALERPVEMVSKGGPDADR